MNAPASSLLLPEDDNFTPPPVFQRLLYHYIRAVQQQYHLDNAPMFQPLIDQVDQAIHSPSPREIPGSSSVPL